MPESKMSENKRDYESAQAIATQLVNKSTGADLRATKMLIDTLKDAEKKAGVTAPPEPAPFTAADEEVMATFIARLRQSWEEALQQKGTKPAHCLDVGKESITSAQDRRSIVVIPAKAGIQDPRRLRLPLDPRFPRGVTIPRCKHGLSSRSQALKQ